MNRVVIFVMDSVGIGALPDAQNFGDCGVNTLGNISAATGGIHLENLQGLGLGNIEGIKGVTAVDNPLGAYGKAMEVSNGKDTTVGHWELVGLHVKKPLRTYPDGFPEDIISAFEEKIGRKILGNKAASGTEIIAELGQKHIETGYPIVYTSADSVFQIAAHEEIIPLDELYKMCEIARGLMMGEHAVARIIARPFIGEVGDFSRTANRRDYSLDPFGETLLDYGKKLGLDVIGIGKIEDIFNGKGITEAIHTKDNLDGIKQTIEYLKRDNKGIIFTNLVDFDAKYGHRRDAMGYKRALEEMDAKIPEVLEALKEDDIIIFTADHGNDPTYKGTDHTREYIPIVIYGKNIKEGVNIGIRRSFADIAKTIAEILNIPADIEGESFKALILK
ncbi:phosphopentomutase [Alkaliphilus serpentinus]|uniref:Phosphopentomutase n=1 Tax=Alkaliphilus serpentinus TaxID=1482731 RepID=A0A833HM64_9FIRM|nr:phosphopentomutase [Alkaliphilus serpentinus]KAB3527384.1 phosphopentomutase [Alkaliphilus serpentinus]